ncbi:MAG: Clp protease N-terminal domain-containing protein [Acidimicrobiales bacterium]
MFERFSDVSRAALVEAQVEARLLGHGFVGTGHLLLGLLRSDFPTTAQVLGSMGVTPAAARELLRQEVGPAAAPPLGSPPFTARAKKALELSLREAVRLDSAGRPGDASIEPGHLLLGLMHDRVGSAARVLLQLGADLDQVRSETLVALACASNESRSHRSRGAWTGRWAWSRRWRAVTR